jgi:hypothetical protein
MISGAVHPAEEAVLQDSAAKAGLDLCAVSLVFLVKKAQNGLVPPIPTGRPAPELLSSLCSTTPSVLRLPPSTGPPLPLLFRISRT